VAEIGEERKSALVTGIWREWENKTKMENAHMRMGLREWTGIQNSFLILLISRAMSCVCK